MLWKNLPPKLSKSQFQRLTGVKQRTFDKMCFIVKAVKQKRRKHPHRGHTPKLLIEDQLLMMLMYNRAEKVQPYFIQQQGAGRAQYP